MEPSQPIMPAINNDLKPFGKGKKNDELKSKNDLKEVATEI